MAVVLALISALVYGTSDYLGGRATRGASLFAVTLVTQATTVTLAVLLVTIDDAPFPAPSDVAWSVAPVCRPWSGSSPSTRRWPRGR